MEGPHIALDSSVKIFEQSIQTPHGQSVQAAEQLSGMGNEALAQTGSQFGVLVFVISCQTGFE